MPKLISEVTFYNNTDYKFSDLRRYIKFVYPDNMPAKVTIDISNVGFDRDDEGNKTICEHVAWDGTAYSSNMVDIILNEKLAGFPIIWWPNERLEGDYVRGTFLETPEEYFIYALAHELRHIWQWFNPRRKRLGREYGGDEETDADLYAIMKLFQWRKRK